MNLLGVAGTVRVSLSCYNSYKKGELNIQALNIDQYHRRNLAKKLADIILKRI